MYVCFKKMQLKFDVGNTHKGRLDFEMDCGVFADNLTEEELEFIRLYTKKGDSILNFYLRGLQSPDRNPKQEWKNLVKERGLIFLLRGL